MTTFEENVKKIDLPQNRNADPWIRGLRQKAFSRFREIGIPTRKIEAWRHTPLERILKAPFFPEEAREAPLEDDHAFDRYNLPREGERRVVFLNGVLTERFSHAVPLGKGVVLEDLSDFLVRDAGKIRPFFSPQPEKEENGFSSLNTFRFQKGFVVFVEPGVRVDLPIHLVFAGAGIPEKAPTIYPRLLVVLGKNSSANLVTSYVSVNKAPYLVDGVHEIYLGEGALLHWTLVQRHSEQASSLLTSKCFLDAKSHLERAAFVRGGDVSHHELTVEYRGEEAGTRDFGLSVLRGRSHVSQIFTVCHQASHCVTRQLYKNILSDEAQAEFNSLVHVAAGTRGSDSDQLNRNLILSDSARAYSRPQLKIDADDVSATHGSATGQLDEHELFYLRSRGLEASLARFVLAYGFAEEILEKIKPDSMRWQLELLVRKAIEAM